MRCTAFWVVMSVLVLLGACQPKVIQKYTYYNVPAFAPGTRPEMNTAGFWIGRHKDPDALIMTGEEIREFNTYIAKKTKAVRDITKLSVSRDGRSLASSLRQMLDQNKGYVDSSGNQMPKESIAGMESLMGLSQIPGTVKAQWAYVVRPADQRLLPTEKPYYKSAADTLIDRLQNNALDVATPVLVLVQSTDNKWVYVISPDSEGWVSREKVAFCTLEEMALYESSPDFIVATGAKTDLFLDPWLRQHATSVQMGCRLPFLAQCETSSIQVLAPVRRDDGWCGFEALYVPSDDVHQGYLPYTPRTALTQAFKLLNAPYGWGGMHGEQDCSRFVQEVFASMGIMLPRNSAQQGKVGRLMGSFSSAQKLPERQSILSNETLGGITTLQFPGHIMLYIGSVDSVPYAIHDLFAYTEPADTADNDERLVPINKVVVSSLMIGDGTKKGPFIMRLGTVREVSPEPSSN